MFTFMNRYNCHIRPITLSQLKCISQTTSINGQPHPVDLDRVQFVPKARNKLKARKPNLSRKLRAEFEKHKGETPAIACRLTEFNFYEGMRYSKFDPIPLASQSWNNRKSNGDYFTIFKNFKQWSENWHFGNEFLNDPIKPKFIVNPTGEKEESKEEKLILFSELGIEEELCNALRRLGIQRAADVQVAAIPVILQRLNSLISAHTGSGKTLAFLLPIVQMILNRNRRVVSKEKPINSPSAIIVTPSRELAEQIHGVLLKVIDGLPIQTRLFIGGYLRGKLANPKLDSVDILVSSLGALNKSIAAGIFKINRLHHVVLDEADQLLDKENSTTVNNILKKIKVQYGPPSEDSGAQVVLVSATTPLSLQERLGNILAVDSIERVSTHHLHHVLKNVPQTFLKIGKIHKGKLLLDLVEKSFKKGDSILIFR